MPICGIVFFSGLAFFAYDSATGDGAKLGFRRGPSLSSDMSDILSWFFFLFASFLVVLSAYRLVCSFRKYDDIVFGYSKITMPVNEYSSKTVEIPYKDILSVTVRSLRKTRVAVIAHHHGRVTVTDNCLGSQEAFEEFLSTVSERTRKIERSE